MKRRNLIIAAIVAIALLGTGGFFLLRPAAPAANRTVKAERRTVSQDVAFTGHIRSQHSVKLAFEFSGVVTSQPVSVGDHVAAGQVLATLDMRNSELQLAKAHADRVAGKQNAYLSWQKAEDEAAAAAKSNAQSVAKAAQAVRDAKKEVDQTQSIWEQTVRESGDEPSASQAKYAAVVSAQSAYHSAQQALKSAQTAADASNTTATRAADVAQAAYVATQQAAEGASGLSSSQALENIANVTLSKDALVAPFAGVVTATSVDQGEVATVGVPVVTVETVDQLEYAADVPETDSVKLRPGMLASVTFDAFTTKEAIDAQVEKIAPAAKEIEGVPTFEVTLQSSQADAELRPGLTANITVHAAKKDNVVAIPRRALITSGNRQFVRLQGADGHTRDQDVVAGLVGSDGSVEIVQGLQAGDTVVIPADL
jgi:RND family efflux transporter MFP subunit